MAVSDNNTMSADTISGAFKPDLQTTPDSQITKHDSSSLTRSTNSDFPINISVDNNVMSPNAMAAEAMAAGVEYRNRSELESMTNNENDPINTEQIATNSVKGDCDLFRNFSRSGRAKHQKLEGAVKGKNSTPLSPDITMEKIWNKVKLSHNSRDEFSVENLSKKTGDALRETENILNEKLDGIIQDGLEAFNQCESLMREVKSLKMLCDEKDREVARLRLYGDESRTAVAKLLRAVELGSGSRDQARAVKVEASLRSENNDLRNERDQALGSEVETTRKSKLRHEENILLKAKLTRVIQEKNKLERETRMTVSLQKSMDQSASMDADFNKRKVSELNHQLQTKDSFIMEQKKKLEITKRQLGYSINQKRLVKIRGENINGVGRRKNK